MSKREKLCVAQGTSMAVQRFMALHKPYFPIKAQQLIRPSQLEFVGLVDAQRRDRFGTCARVCESHCPTAALMDVAAPPSHVQETQAATDSRAFGVRTDHTTRR